MKAADAIKLNQWVSDNKAKILLERLTQKDLAEQADKALGFKVSTNSLRDCLEANQIPTYRRGKVQVEMDALKADIAKLNGIIERLAKEVTVPEWLRKELLLSDISDTIKDCLKARRPAKPDVA